MDSATKQNLLNEFQTMKLIEQDAREFYLKASNDPEVTDQNLRDSLVKIAEDEAHHVELVERMMTIVKNCL
jgi:rubrerythrin